MKERSKKWISTVCLYSFAVVLSVVISSVCFTENTSALKHNFNNLFIPSFVYYDSNHVSHSTNQYYYSYHPSSSQSVPLLNSQTLTCGSNSYSSLSGSSGSVLSGSYSTFHFNVGTDFDSATHCFRPDSDTWYSYSGLKIQKSDSNLSTPATLRDIFGDGSSNMYVFALPLTLDPSKVGSLSQNRQLHFHGEFSSNQSFVYPDTVYPEIHVSGVHSSLDSSSTYSYSWKDASSSSDSNYCTSLVLHPNHQRLEFDCYITLSHSYSEFTTFGVVFHPHSWFNSNSDNGDLLWSNSGEVFFTNWYVITDNDDTPSLSDASPSLTGNNLSSSPTYEGTEGTSYTSSLINLFNFSIFNPFAPLFGMFSDNSQCAQIPIIAGMLGTDQTTYCPWFDNTTRSILTPILSFAGIMIVFGFLVRWLGASSGNLFEDTTREEVSNQGGRWGHFKKGGVS